MSRIRTIKPEFWTNPQVVHVALAARLLFIGTWNFADDYGNLPRDPEKLKMQIFPGVNDAGIDVEPLILSLIHQGLLTEYSVRGKRYLHITGFGRHQVINRPSRPAHPLPEEADGLADRPHGEADSLNAHAPLTEYSRTEKEGSMEKEKDKTKGTNKREWHNPRERAREGELAPVRPTELSSAMRRNSVAASPSDPRVIAAANHGVTPETIEAACVEAKACDPIGRIKAGYDLAIAERWTQRAAQTLSSARAQGPPFALTPLQQREAEHRRVAQGLTRMSGPASEIIDGTVTEVHRVAGQGSP